MKNLSFKKYRGTEKGHFKIPWIFYDNLPQWLQNHQREVFKRDLSLAECQAAVRRMQQISDAARRAGKFNQIIIKHDAATDRWASYGTADDRVILEAKGRIKPGSYADRMRSIEACSRSQMLEHIADRFECSEKEAVRLFNIFKSKANNTIRFDSKKDGYGDTWRSWDVRQKSPQRTTQETMIAGTRCEEYRKLVAGIDRKRHNYKEALESSEFLQALDARIIETGFTLDIKENQSRFAALDALRNRIWNVTKQEELKPLTGLRQPDGSWLLSAQTESQAEQELKKARKLLKADEIDFQAFRKWFYETEVEEWDNAPQIWNTTKKVVDELMDEIEQIEMAEAARKKAEEKKAADSAFYKARSEAEAKVESVVKCPDRYNPGAIRIAVSNAFQEDRTLSMKTFKWRLKDSSKLSSDQIDSIANTIKESGVVTLSE
jgi:nucleotide-binding universal stress UspA family protein